MRRHHRGRIHVRREAVQPRSGRVTNPAREVGLSPTRARSAAEMGSTVNGALSCEGNSAEAKDFGAPNRINGVPVGDSAAL